MIFNCYYYYLYVKHTTHDPEKPYYGSILL
jgi:hypothetical protein